MERVGFSPRVDSRDEWGYARILQIISTRFASFFASAEEQLEYLLSVATLIDSPALAPKPHTEQSLYEDLLGAICQNQYLLYQLMEQWIPRADWRSLAAGPARDGRGSHPLR